MPVFVLVNAPDARRYLLTNADGYSLTYNGLVVAVDKRRSDGWQAFGSYTFSRSSGLQPSSGATAAGAQVSTVSPPPAQTLTFGRDPNDLTNARGLLPNDRPHVFRMMGSVDVPKTGLTAAANLGALQRQALGGRRSGLDPPEQPAAYPARGARLAPAVVANASRSPSVEDRLSWGSARVDVMVDVLNALNSTAAEGILTDILSTETLAANPDFGKPNAVVDPRRAMLGVRLNFGR